MVTVNGYITTPVFGGQEGELFNDVFCSTKDTGTLFFSRVLLRGSHHYGLGRCLLGQRFRGYVVGHRRGRQNSRGLPVMKAIKMNYPIATIQVFVDIFVCSDM